MAEPQDFDATAEIATNRKVRTAVPLPPGLTARDPRNDGSPDYYVRETDEPLFRYMLGESIRIEQGIADSHKPEMRPVTFVGDEAANAHIIQEDATRRVERARTNIIPANAALRKLDHDAANPDQDPTFGICESTGEDISYYRLLTQPAAKMTAEAQGKLEKEAQQTRTTEGPYRFSRPISLGH